MILEAARLAVMAYERYRSSPPSEEADELFDEAMRELSQAIAAEDRAIRDYTNEALQEQGRWSAGGRRNDYRPTESHG